VNKYVAPSLLYLLAAFMLLGFVRSGLVLNVTTIIALLLTVILPAGLATHLLLSRSKTKRVQLHQGELRMRTIEAEILRIAQLHSGRLTIVEIVSGLAIKPEEAKLAVDSLVRQEIADIEITDSGVLVYVFHDIRLLHEKSSARGLLE
jgi:hypothetical protein